MSPAYRARYIHTDDLGSQTRALTVQQPWASLIAHGRKDVENRSWDTHYRGTLLIHAGKAIDPSAPIHADLEQPRGAFVALAQLVDVIADSRSRWARPEQLHWTLGEIVLLDRPIAARGSLRLWKPDPSDLFEIRHQLAGASSTLAVA